MSPRPQSVMQTLCQSVVKCLKKRQTLKSRADLFSFQTVETSLQSHRRRDAAAVICGAFLTKKSMPLILNWGHVAWFVCDDVLKLERCLSAMAHLKTTWYLVWYHYDYIDTDNGCSICVITWAPWGFCRITDILRVPWLECMPHDCQTVTVCLTK